MVKFVDYSIFFVIEADAHRVISLYEDIGPAHEYGFGKKNILRLFDISRMYQDIESQDLAVWAFRQTDDQNIKLYLALKHGIDKDTDMYQKR